ncbi:hypothetical protein M9978_22820 [Sphingomonas sp. MG17]|uniref:Uncharacterized protein n=1 Tax=Sphingomonas tagetis TaxID=2949092 RepID=A0A9X2KNV7_9SPHN|nr:hypothetical protein [Sphingomonas tagetis]MCP3733242.1 hypothetical protein [Sphingomonas tagetis]
MNNLIPITQPARIGAPVKTRAASAASRRHTALIALWRTHHAEPVQLQRTREGRDLSRARYRRAEEFMLSLAPEAPGDGPDFLYNAGIVAQLALSSHLLDVGFPDTWCARYIGLHVARSLAYANATGFGHDCAETKRLADVLTPYWKWNRRSLADAPRPNDGGFSPDNIRALSRALLDHVGQVTGHGQARRRMT